MAAVSLLSQVLLLSVWSVLSGCYRLDGVEVYEVVRPIRLHDVQKRDLQSSRPDLVKYALTLEGKHIEMHLEKNNDFISEDYTETHYTDDGTPVTTKPDQLDLCYYQGKIVNDSDSLVTMSTCDGLRGYLQTAEQRFLIEPLSEDADGDHAVMKFEDVTNTPAVCGVTNTSWDSAVDGIPPRTGKSRSRASGPTIVQRQKYSELFLVADNRMYQKMNRDISQVRKRIYEIVNFVNAVYKPLNTFIAVIGLEVWTDSDKSAVTGPAGETLDKFTKWRNDVLMKRQKHDNAQLITGIDLDGSTVGLAFIGTLCSVHSTGIIQDHNPRAIAVGATMAHEMGHNLGLNHDTNVCVCSAASCIMAAALSYNIPQYFSSCSVSQYEDYLNNRNPECLLNKPQASTLLQPAVCGNGFKEIGEDCDCGSVEECNNPCCNATSCKLTKESQCADGACCRDCKIVEANQICRDKVDECDLPEYCTGNSNSCPENVFVVNGLPCKNGRGYCYNGQCPLREDQCIKMWGPNAVLGSEYCYNYNVKGLYYGYCSRPSNDLYIGCQKQDVMCGKLFCENGLDSPNYGRLVSIGNCKATFYGDRENDFGQVDHGTKCGEEKVCSQNQCVTLEVAYKATNCSAKCQGHGVCNHKLECSCEPGWLPPDCQTQTSSVMSIGIQAAIIIGVCFFLGLILTAVGFFLMKRRKSKPQQTRHQVQVQDSVANPRFGPQKAAAPRQSQFTAIHPKGPPPARPPPKPSAPPAPPKVLYTDFKTAQKALRPPPPPPPPKV